MSEYERMSDEDRLDALLSGGMTLEAAEEQMVRDDLIIAAVRAGGSMRTVGPEFGISHERVRQIVDKVDPQATIDGQTARANERLARQQEALPQRVEKVCVVCKTPFFTTDPRRVTDRTECAAEWDAGLRHRGSEQHYDNTAKSILRRPHNYPPYKVAWAERRRKARGFSIEMAS